MWHIYENVPECPKCHSSKVSKIVYNSLTIHPKQTVTSLRHGLYLSFDSRNYQQGMPTCNCLQCGLKWHAYIPIQIIKTKQLQQEKIRRGISDEQEEYVQEIFNNDQQMMRDQQKECKTKKIKNTANTIIRYIRKGI